MKYAYYTLNALAIDVPGAVKRTLTTLQIIQIIFGAFYAFAHLFVAYDIPGSQAYRYVHNLSTALPSTASSVSFTLSSALSSATAAAGFGSWIKKAALRAAGEEGLAENVRNYQGETFGIDAVHAAEVEKSQEEIRYRMTFQKVHCLDTSGQVLAILMNLVYLAPLVYLFLNFFYRSYTSRSNTEPPKPSQQENVRLSSEDAVKDIEREIQEAVDERQGGATEPPPEWKAKLEDAKQNAKESGKDIGEKVQANAKDLGTKAQNGASDLSAKAKDAAGDLPAKAQNGASDLSDKAKDAARGLPAKAQEGAGGLSARAKDAAGDLPAKAQNGADDLGAKTKNPVKDAKDSFKDDLQALQERMKKMGGEEAKPKSSSDDKAEETGDGKGKSDGDVSKPAETKKSEKDDTKKGQHEDTKMSQNEDIEDQEEGSEMDGDAMTYEVVPDEPKTAAEKKAEESMQPKQS